MALVENVMFGLSLLTLLSQLGIILLFLLWLGKKAGINFAIRLHQQALELLSARALQFAFIVVLVAMSGSLFFEHVAGWKPCKLCWWQRIFMYPQVFIFAIALWKKNNHIFQYTFLLSVIGALIAAYHWALQALRAWFPEAPAAVCSISGPSCSFTPTMTFGYITIPMMALTAFVLTIVLWEVRKRKETLNYGK